MEESPVLQSQKPSPRPSGLSLCCCGRCRCAPLQSYGPAARPSHLLHYVIEGRGSCRLQDREHRLGKGEGFLLRPGQEALLQADREEPWSYLWVGFGGSGCEAFLRTLGLGHGQVTFRCRDEEGQLPALVDRMLAEEAGTGGSRELLEQFFACLAQGATPAGSLTKGEREQLYVHQAVEFIRSSYAGGITVEEVARAVALDRSYLYTLFRRVLNTSPRDYLARFRLTRAREMLLLTDSPIAVIASNCGYQDPHVFSKAFRQLFGATPSEYRRREKEGEGEADSGK